MNLPARKMVRTSLLTGGVILILVIISIVSCFLNAWVMPSRFKAEAEQRLRTARTSEEFEKAVGGLGIYLTATNGAWVAIAYRDDHLPPGWQKAIALTSGGSWFESENHFCGIFLGYRTILRHQREVSTKAATNSEARELVIDLSRMLEQDVKIHELTLVSNLNELDARLIGFGFRKYK